MKKIAVIGPDQRTVHAVASQLTRCRAVVGAGPQDDLNGVVAVVGAWTPEDQKVVDAVSQAMGAVMLYRPPRSRSAEPEGRAWQEQPGVYHCATVADVQEAVDTIVLNSQRWLADARRADLERSERVRVAVKLEMNRVASEIIQDPQLTDSAAAHRTYTQHLRVALLRQGVACPTFTEPESRELDAGREARVQQIIALVAGLIGGLALGFAIGRALGQPLWGVLAGVVLALFGAVARVWMVQAAERKARAAQRAVALKEAWNALTADVLARVQIPRVADAVGGR